MKATAGLAPYSANTVTRVTLDQDMLYPGTGTPGGPPATSSPSPSV
ncbi:hypothetical protein ACWERV_33140 [Streptomyces sp. NPDC004031]